MAARIIGLGQEWAGDDGAGLAVVRRLRAILSPLPQSAVEEWHGPAAHSAGMEILSPVGRAAVPAIDLARAGGHGGPLYWRAAIFVGEGEGVDTLLAPIPAPRRDPSERGSTAIDLLEATDPTQLITLLTDGADPVVIIDAVLDQGPVGRVLLIDARGDSRSTHLLSTHGVGVLEAIELARIAHPKEVAQRILIVGITIQNANRGGTGLSPPVSAAIPIAAVQALKLAEN